MQRVTSQLNTAIPLGTADALCEQRKQHLYPPLLARSALDNQVLRCHARSGPIADALRRQLLAGAPVRVAWQRAAVAGEPDTLRALLLLLEEREIVSELARPLFLSPLQQVRAMPGMTNPGMTAVIKEYPYYPTGWQEQGIPVLPRNLNMAARVQGNDTEKIVCRHLAIDHVQRMAQDSTAIKCTPHTLYRDVAAVEANIGTLTGQQYISLLAHARETHLISNDRFGQFLIDQFSAMQRAGNVATKVMLLDSANHSMSMGLRVKVKDGRPVYVVRLFDPNRTTHHARSSTSNLATFAARDLADWLDGDATRQAYYPEANAVSLISVHDVRDGIDAEANSVPAPGRTLTSFSCALDETVMHHLLRYGFTGDLQQIGQHFTGLSDARKFGLLRARNAAGVSGLYIALSLGQASTVSAFARLLESIPDDARVAILGATHQGVPCLYGAVHMKQAAAIRAFGAALAVVPAGQRADLVRASGGGIQPALHLALCEREGDVIRAFEVALGMVPPEFRAELVAACLPDGNPGLSGMIVFRKHGADAVNAFGTLLALVPEHQRAELLAARDHNGIPALAYILIRGEDIDMLQAFGALLSLIPAQQHAGLLRADMPDGLFGERLIDSAKYPAMQAAYQELLQRVLHPPQNAP